MSTFYLLPPRAELARRWAEFLQSWLPGLADAGAGLADHLAEAAAHRPGVYLVFADDLADGDDLAVALRDGFGADAGDRIIDRRTDFATAVAAP